MKTQQTKLGKWLRSEEIQPIRSATSHSPLPWKVAGDLDGVREDYREDRCLITDDFDYDERTGSIIGVLRGHGPELRANAAFIVRAVNNAQRLADALADVELRATQDRLASGIGKRKNQTAFLLGALERIADEAREALAQWEGSK